MHSIIYEYEHVYDIGVNKMYSSRSPSFSLKIDSVCYANFLVITFNLAIWNHFVSEMRKKNISHLFL